MSQETKINYWDSDLFKKLSPNAKYLFMYLKTCEYNNFIGIFKLFPKEEIIKTHTGLTKVEIDAAIRDFDNTEFEHRLVNYKDYFIFTSQLYNTKLNYNQQKTAIHDFRQLPVDISKKLAGDHFKAIYETKISTKGETKKMSKKQKETIRKGVEQAYEKLVQSLHQHGKKGSKKKPTKTAKDYSENVIAFTDHIIEKYYPEKKPRNGATKNSWFKCTEKLLEKYDETQIQLIVYQAINNKFVRRAYPKLHEWNASKSSSYAELCLEAANDKPKNGQSQNDITAPPKKKRQAFGPNK